MPHDSWSFSSDFYDPPAQGLAWWYGDSANTQTHYRRALKARLRFDYLTTRGITFNRADILDGCWFLLTSPAEVADWLGLEADRPSRLRILTLHGSLSEDLIRWPLPRGADQLNPEFLEVLDPQARDAYRQRLGNIPISSVTTWQDVPKCIARAIRMGDVNDAQSFGDYVEDSLTRAWEPWITQSQRFFAIERFSPNKPKYEQFILPELTNQELEEAGVDPASPEAKHAQHLYLTAKACLKDGKGGLLAEWFDQELRNGDRRFARIVGHIKRDLDISRCLARADANDTLHESVLSVDLSESRVRAIIGRLTSRSGLAERPAEFIDIGLLPELAQLLADCPDEAFKQIVIDVEPLRQRWIMSQEGDDLKRFADFVGDRLIRSQPSVERSRLMISTCHVSGFLSATPTLALGYMLHSVPGWPDAFGDAAILRQAAQSYVRGFKVATNVTTRVTSDAFKWRVSGQIMRTIRARPSSGHDLVEVAAFSSRANSTGHN